MRRSDLDYSLPDELIARVPPPERDGARMLVVSADGSLAHRSVRDLPGALAPALFIVNDTRVIPARLRTRKATGGKVELLLVERLSRTDDAEEWLAMGRASKGLAEGLTLAFGDAQRGVRLKATVLAKTSEGMLRIELRATGGVDAALERVGEVPLPPYLEREPDAADRERYQTVFARAPGAVAAPTAGLHLSEALLASLEAAGHRLAAVTLHVGPGTFQPIGVERLEDHVMHEEAFEVPEATARAIDGARAEGRAVVAVGTTVVRALESAAAPGGRVTAGPGRTSIFIRPPYTFRVVDALLTNFHLPGSTLLALVMALGGVDALRAAYAEAVRERYRFFSYGDAMLLTARAPLRDGAAGAP